MSEFVGVTMKMLEQFGKSLVQPMVNTSWLRVDV